MLKGLSGVTTHAHREWIPVLENDQDMRRLALTNARRVRELEAELTTMRNLSSVLAREGKLDEADRLVREAVPRQRALSGDVSAEGCGASGGP